MSKFIASFLRGASPINPDTIEITDNSVIFKKLKIYLLGYDTIVIPFSKISSVELNSSLIGTNITIKSFGEGTIEGHRFSLSDAKEMKRLIEEQM
ncbi:MAG: PH domain-containing protein [Bacteroidales bacterium]|jgi:hypothetical protein